MARKPAANAAQNKTPVMAASAPSAAATDSPDIAAAGQSGQAGEDAPSRSAPKAKAKAKASAPKPGDIQPGDIVTRHRLGTRLWHGVNALAFFLMLMSGLMIFNAHPRLYWGKAGANYDPAWLEIGASGNEGYLMIGSWAINTTGFLGLWQDSAGLTQARAFPGWATIPSYYSLADARLWHLAFAWVLALSLLAFMVASLINGHFARDFSLHWRELRPSHIWQDIKDHARLRLPTGAAALHYHILQKLSYIAVIFILLPLIIFTGLTMSPNLDAGMTPLLDLFGGRQSARSLHFIAAFLLLAFFIVHMLMVVLAGPVNELRAITTGRFRVPGPRASGSEAAPPPQAAPKTPGQAAEQTSKQAPEQADDETSDDETR